MTPVGERGKVGHEKGYWLYPGYLERRGVHFMFEGAFGQADAWREVWFAGTIPARLVRYDRALMRELRRRDPGLRAVDFERFLDDYIAGLAGRGKESKEQVAADLGKFKLAYFDHEDDAPRLRSITEWLARTGG